MNSPVRLKKGLRVICLDDTIDQKNLLLIEQQHPNWIKQGETYTIRGIIVYRGKEEDVISLLFEEIRNPEIYYAPEKIMLEPGFAVRRFAVEVQTVEGFMGDFSAN